MSAAQTIAIPIDPAGVAQAIACWTPYYQAEFLIMLGFCVEGQHYLDSCGEPPQPRTHYEAPIARAMISRSAKMSGTAEDFILRLADAIRALRSGSEELGGDR